MGETSKVYRWVAETRTFEEVNNEPREPQHYIIQDTMDATWHPCDGRTYDSKSEFRRVTKASGGIETGGEKVKPREGLPYELDRTERKKDIYNAIQDLRRNRRR